MPLPIYLVKAGMTMTEGTVSVWHVRDGQDVTLGEPLYSLETEKINLDVESEGCGTVKILVDAGVTLKPGDVIGHIYEDGEEVPIDATNEIPGAVEEVSPAVRPTGVEVHTSQSIATPGRKDSGRIDARIRISPLARRLAKALNMDYTQMVGSGPGGRIIKRDVLELQGRDGKAYPVTSTDFLRDMSSDHDIIDSIHRKDVDVATADRRADTRPVSSQAPKSIPVTGMRKAISDRMSSSLRNSAQLSMNMEVKMGACVESRSIINAEWRNSGLRASYTDFVIMSVAKALAGHSLMNSRFDGDQITILPSVNIGVAVALPDGLIVPVIRDANTLCLKEIVEERTRLISAAKNAALRVDDITGATFTISTLGSYGVDSFTPIIDEPQVGILGVNRIYDGFDWMDEKPIRVKKMNLSLTWDHRVIDGAPAAEFLSEVCRSISSPIRLLALS